MKEYYIKIKETIKEEQNDAGETTYFIKGEISKEGEPWEECMFIWDGNMRKE